MAVRFQSQFQLNTNKYLQQCDPKDVISFNSEKWIDVNKLKKNIYQSFHTSGISSVSNYMSQNSRFKNSGLWFQQGEQCEILRAGSQGWQKGKIKINVTLEFIPDEVEEKSPLDDIREARLNNPPQR